MRRTTPIRLTLEAAAREFAVSKETLRRGLRALDQETRRGKRYDLQTIYRALAGDLKAERTRLTRADAAMRELELSRAKGDLVQLSEVAAIINPVLLTVRQRLNALPSEAGSKCNPTDPQLAEQQLSDWVARTLPQIRERLPYQTAADSRRARREPPAMCTGRQA